MESKFLLLLFVLATLSFACGLKKTAAVNPATNCILGKYNDLQAKVINFQNSDSLNAYRIISAKKFQGTPKNFGSFALEIISHQTPIAASNKFHDWKKSITKPSEFYKAPQYRFVYQHYIFSIETGCGNEDNLDSIFHFIQDCFNSLERKSIDLARIKCGGEIVED